MNNEQVASYLYLGGLEAAHNEQVLCQRKIASLVDVSGPLNNRERLARERILRKRSFPCTCQLAVAHSRAKLSVQYVIATCFLSSSSTDHH